jgi:hypothetical protein
MDVSAYDIVVIVIISVKEDGFCYISSLTYHSGIIRLMGEL